MDIHRNHLCKSLLAATSIFFFFSCSSSPQPDTASNFVKVGSFSASYDATLGTVSYQSVNSKNDPSGGALSTHGLSYSDSTGVADGVIIDHSKSPGAINYFMGLVDPDSCSTDYNNTTHILSFYAKLVNESNLPNNYPGVPTGYEYTNVASFPPNTTFFTPFYFVITGLDWNTGSYPQLITAINTNLQGASCGAANGLTLASCDGSGIYSQSSPNNRFDSVWPDNPVSDYSGLPGWDFTPYVTSGSMAPGANTGCVLFQQYTLTQNQSFTLYFDLLAVKQSGSAPLAPTVVSPSTPSYVNTSSVNVAGSCLPTTGTVYVDGGSSSSSPSVACSSTPVAFTATRTNGSPILTAVSSLSGLVPGMLVTGTGIPANARISSIGTTTITLSANATASGTSALSATITFTGTRTLGSPILTAVSSVQGLLVGMTLTGTGIAANTTISAIGTNTVTMSINPTSAGTNTVTASGTFNLNVPLRLNQLNNLSVYQIAGGLQSPSTNLAITQDSIAPTLVSWSPANGEVVVGTTARCIATFSEAMADVNLTATTTNGSPTLTNISSPLGLQTGMVLTGTGIPAGRTITAFTSTTITMSGNANANGTGISITSSFFNGGTGTGGGSCGTGNFVMCQGTNRVAGTITLSSDKTQAVYTPTGVLSASTAYSCNIATASGAPTTLKDLAGNSISANSSITFTTGTLNQDLTAPYVKGIIPADNSTVSTTSKYYIYFSEPVQSASLTATDCSSGGTMPNIAVWETVTCPRSSGNKGSPLIINGTISLNATGDVATFTPTTSIVAGDCLAITVAGCTGAGVKDLAGNSLANRGSFTVGAYGQTLQYNSWNNFYTLNTADSTGPTLVHAGPILGATGVHSRIYPFVVFDEPIDINTVLSNYFYLTPFGNPTKINVSLKADSTLQMVTYKTGSTTSTFTADTTNSSNTLANVSSTSSAVVGLGISGAGIPVNTTISSVNAGANTITISNNATATATGTTITVTLFPNTSLNNVFTVTGAVTDTSGNQMTSPQTSNYTTTSSLDTTLPTVVSVTPANGSTVSRCSKFDLYFSEPIDDTTINGANVQLVQGGVGTVIPVDSDLSDDGMHLILFPQSSLYSGLGTVTFTARKTNNSVTLTNVTSFSGLAVGMNLSGNRIQGGTTITAMNTGASTITMSLAATGNSTSAVDATGCGTSNAACNFTPTIGTGLKDRAGNALALTYNSTTVTASTDGTAPTVTSIVPGNGSTVAQNGSFLVLFSEAMDRSTMTNANFTFGSGCSSGFKSVFPSSDGTWAIINCYQNMNAGAASLTVAGTNVRDRYITTDGGDCESGGGNTIGSNSTINFTVNGADDTMAPTVNTVSPSDQSTSVSTAVAPSVTFSEAIDPRTLLPSTIFLMDQQGNLIDSTISFNSTSTTVTLTPVQALSNPGFYYIVGTTAIRDLGGANNYDGLGGETTPVAGVLRTCFSTSAATCP